MSAEHVAYAESPGWLPNVRSATITVPAEARAGDLLVVTGYVELPSGGDATRLDGYLPTAAVAFPGGWWHCTWVLPREQVTSGALNWGGQQTNAAWRVDVVRGADTGAVPAISTDNGFGRDVTAPSVATKDGGLLLWIVASDTARESIAPPSGMDLVGDLTPWSFAIVAAEEATSGGSSGSRTGSYPQETGWTVTMLAIPPAPATTSSVRWFDGVDDVLLCSQGACAITSAVTMAALVRPGTLTPNRWSCVLSNCDHANLHGYSLEIWRAAGTQFVGMWADDTFGSEGPSVQSGEWSLVVVSKAAGTATPRFRVWTWRDGVPSGPVVADGHLQVPDASVIQSGDHVTIGAKSWGAYPFTGEVAAAAMWPSALSDQQAADLAEAGTLREWTELHSPAGVWLFNQPSTAQPVVDLMGNGADQDDLEGTVVRAVDPPIPYGVEPVGATVWALVEGRLVPVTVRDHNGMPVVLNG